MAVNIRRHVDFVKKILRRSGARSIWSDYFQSVVRARSAIG
jgi:hypothetical protein